MFKKIFVSCLMVLAVIFGSFGINLKQANAADLAFNSYNQFLIDNGFTAGTPLRMVTNDFNSDGNIDIAVITGDIGTISKNYVSILLGNGSGGFAPVTNIMSGSTSSADIASGDFNSDGKIDLAVAQPNLSGYTVLMFIGNGAGGFAAPVSTLALSGDSKVSRITAADFNNDGKMDLVGTNNFGKIVVLLGDGTGSFTVSIVLATSNTRPSSSMPIKAGDFNMDSNMDLILADPDFGYVYFYSGNGNGTFATPERYFSGAYPTNITVADFNADGGLDFAVSNYQAQNVSVFLKNPTVSSTTFLSPITLPMSHSPYDIVAVDLNLDDKVDIATINKMSGSQSGTVSVFLGDGSGNFDPVQYFLAGSSNFTSPNIQVADFNNDTKKDIITSGLDLSAHNVVSMLTNATVIPAVVSQITKSVTADPDAVVNEIDGGITATVEIPAGATGEYSVKTTCSLASDVIFKMHAGDRSRFECNTSGKVKILAEQIGSQEMSIIWPITGLESRSCGTKAPPCSNGHIAIGNEFVVTGTSATAGIEIVSNLQAELFTFGKALLDGTILTYGLQDAGESFLLSNIVSNTSTFSYSGDMYSKGHYTEGAELIDSTKDRIYPLVSGNIVSNYKNQIKHYIGQSPAAMKEDMNLILSPLPVKTILAVGGSIVGKIEMIEGSNASMFFSKVSDTAAYPKLDVTALAGSSRLVTLMKSFDGLENQTTLLAGDREIVQVLSPSALQVENYTLAGREINSSFLGSDLFAGSLVSKANSSGLSKYTLTKVDANNVSILNSLGDLKANNLNILAGSSIIAKSLPNLATLLGLNVLDREGTSYIADLAPTVIAGTELHSALVDSADNAGLALGIVSKAGDHRHVTRDAYLHARFVNQPAGIPSLGATIWINNADNAPTISSSLNAKEQIFESDIAQTSNPLEMKIKVRDLDGQPDGVHTGLDRQAPDISMNDGFGSKLIAASFKDNLSVNNLEGTIYTRQTTDSNVLGFNALQPARILGRIGASNVYEAFPQNGSVLERETTADREIFSIVGQGKAIATGLLTQLTMPDDGQVIAVGNERLVKFNPLTGGLLEAKYSPSEGAPIYNMETRIINPSNREVIPSYVSDFSNRETGNPIILGILENATSGSVTYTNTGANIVGRDAYVKGCDCPPWRTNKLTASFIIDPGAIFEEKVNAIANIIGQVTINPVSVVGNSLKKLGVPSENQYYVDLIDKVHLSGATPGALANVLASNTDISRLGFFADSILDSNFADYVGSSIVSSYQMISEFAQNIFASDYSLEGTILDNTEHANAAQGLAEIFGADPSTLTTVSVVSIKKNDPYRVPGRPMPMMGRVIRNDTGKFGIDGDQAIFTIYASPTSFIAVDGAYKTQFETTLAALGRTDVKVVAYEKEVIGNEITYLFDADRLGKVAMFEGSNFISLALDADVDGVPNSLDQCPNIPGAAAKNGCPFSEKKTVIIHKVLQNGSDICGYDNNGRTLKECSVPGADVVVRTFNRNSPEFISAFGSGKPSKLGLNTIYNGGLGQVSERTTDANGVAIIGLPDSAKYLNIAKYSSGGKDVYFGKFVNLQTGCAVNNKENDDSDSDESNCVNSSIEKNMRVEEIWKNNGTIDLNSTLMAVVIGSELDVIYPEYTIWDNAVEEYPVIMKSAETWDVNVCMQVPEGYQVTAVSDQDGNTLPASDCVQSFIAGETKVIFFTVTDYQSPEPNFSMSLNTKHNGKTKNQSLSILGIRKAGKEAMDKAMNAKIKEVKDARNNKNKAGKTASVKTSKNASTVSLWTVSSEKLGADASGGKIRQIVKTIAEKNSIAIPEWGIAGRIDARALQTSAIEAFFR